jgi:hypothetical protein
VPNINVPVDQAVYDAAKVSAAKAGMLFRKWVERAIADACEQTNSGYALRQVQKVDSVRLREPVNVPLEDA